MSLDPDECPNVLNELIEVEAKTLNYKIKSPAIDFSNDAIAAADIIDVRNLFSNYFLANDFVIFEKVTATIKSIESLKEVTSILIIMIKYYKFKRTIYDHFIFN
jgi:hypothetical protein